MTKVNDIRIINYIQNTKRRNSPLQTRPFMIKRKGFFMINTICIALFSLFLYFIYIKMDNQSYTTIIALFLLGLFIMTSSYLVTEFTIKFDEQSIHFNKVATIPYQEIQKVYIGDFHFIESFEIKDNLPLQPFKHKTLDFLLKKQKKLLSIYAGNRLYLVPIHYFSTTHLQKALMLLKEKGILCEKQV